MFQLPLRRSRTSSSLWATTSAGCSRACYHRGLMVGERRISIASAKKARCSSTITRRQSCTAGRTAFFTGMNLLRAGILLPRIPWQPFLSSARHTLRSPSSCMTLATPPASSARTTWATTRTSLPTAHGFQEFWGYLYHLDAMQAVSFPDVNKTPTEQTIAPPCKMAPVPGISDPPGAIDPSAGLCLPAPRPVLRCTSSDGTAPNQTCKDEGPLTLERSKTVDEEISAAVIDFLDRNDPKKTSKPFFVWYNPARMHIVTVLSDEVHGHGWLARRQGLGHQRSRHEADGRQYRPRP